jgi:hypothetical protein
MNSTGFHAQLPKLHTRVRFPSPAPANTFKGRHKYEGVNEIGPQMNIRAASLACQNAEKAQEFVWLRDSCGQSRVRAFSRRHPHLARLEMG